MSVFEAKYAGRCMLPCGYPIRPGDDVQYLDDELMHADCAQRAIRENSKAVCSRCNMQHAGECM